MNSNNNKKEIIRKQVKSVEFGFYTDNDVRSRSVCEVTSSQSFDVATHNALPGGLYDPRLGCLPSDKSPCTTCALLSRQCPGHYGHIELALPVYHPLLFTDLIVFLRSKCFHCHKLKATKRQLDIFRAKFHLLYTGQISELLELDDNLAVAVYRTKEGMIIGNSGGTRRSAGANDLADSTDDEDYMEEAEPTSNKNSNKKLTAAAVAAKGAAAMDQLLRNYQPKSTADFSHRRKLNSYERQVRFELIKECINACKSKSSARCDHCGAFTISIRQDSHNKLFQKPLSKQSRRIHAAEGIVMKSALDDSNNKQKRNNNQDGDDEYDSDDSTTAAPATGTTRDGTAMSDDDDDDDDDAATTSNAGGNASSDKYMHPKEVQAQVLRTWELDPFLCNCLFGSMGPSFKNDASQIYFMQAIPVPPSRFRPPMMLMGMSIEHSQTQYLSKTIQLNERLRDEFFTSKNESRAYSTWIELQTTVNCFMDSSKDPNANASVQPAPGIRQILERKEGLFRKNMMGKRVDYACRSVISPDPYIGSSEIGLPRYFAHVLTYPTPVTDLNIREMRHLVERGCDEYPGARWVEIDSKRIDLSKMNRHKREAFAARLLTHVKDGTSMPAIVGRQLRDGDYVLMNRQPTLHKPGIMAHRVRILHNPTQRTIRMHYANCNTYNADYDGDEMNCHYPQSDLARAEAQYIANSDLQYIVPTDGSPLRGLIQDHVVGGVKLTKRDTFLSREEYQQLMFAALSSLPGLEIIGPDKSIKLLPPTVMYPKELWTGKQVISTLLLNLRHGTGCTVLPGLSCERKSKTPESAFGPLQEEHLVLVRDGELLRGVLDKAAFGATDFSLVHACYEAYGPIKAGLLLNSLGRLFTAFIQFYSGHSCRIEDLVLTKEAEQTRRDLIQRAYNLGSRAAKVWADSEGGKVEIPSVENQPNANAPLKPVEVASACAKIGELLSGNEGSANFAALDTHMQGQLNPLASDIVKKVLPQGLAVPFPYNTFGVMTTTGAKGSIVNQSQVTCALGQQALEGRRVPRLSSGRTLPSFAAYDPQPRADGFVLDRFLTGVRPQEYYFHCMAGREGLVDTAVKTSRSGYLQRCLVKHLEELKIEYDFTVRNAEGGIVQFLYGEDGVDPTKASYLDCSNASFEFMARNFDSISRQNSALPHSTIEIAAKDAKMAAANAVDSAGSNPGLPTAGQFVHARRLRAGTEWKRGALCKGWHRATVIKVHDNGNKLDLKYLDDGQVAKMVPLQVDLGHSRSARMTAVVSNLATIVKPGCYDPILSDASRGHRLGSSGACVSEQVASAASTAIKNGTLPKIMSEQAISSKAMSSLISAKYSSSLCAPGEAVGSIAAQGIGEPSTQMTLNTFHLAGSGANVTLGIPRLREIIMTASKDLKTPTMSIPLRDTVTEAEALRLTRDFSKITLMELIAGHHGVSVTERLEKGGSGEWLRVYYVILKFHPAERIREAFGLSLHDVASVVAKNYVPLVSQYMKQELRRSSVEAEVVGGESTKYVNDLNDQNAEAAEEGGSRQRRLRDTPDELNDEDDDDGADDDEAPTAEDGADAARYRRRRATSISYDDDDDEQGGEDSSAESDSDDDDDSSQSSTPHQTAGTSQVTASASGPMSPDIDLLAGKTTPTVDERSNTISLQPLHVDPAAPPLLMVGLVEKAAAATLIRSKHKIDQAFVNKEDNGRGRCLQTAGVNFQEMWKLPEEVVDHSRLMSNDIWAVRCAYGVEAARLSIVDQVKSVFGAYGITVDPRHLSLIADYMTFEGGYKAMNRIGMELSSSPFLQMSFETTAHFLKKAAMANLSDEMTSPSGNIVTGCPIQHGTGSFSLLTKTAV